MLTLPKVVDRPETAYVAIAKHVTLPFDDRVSQAIDELLTLAGNSEARRIGPIFFKHNLIAMPDIEMEFGFPVDREEKTAGDLIGGVLPAGRYAEITYFGHYDDLITVNGVLIGWAKLAGLQFDSRDEANGEWFANRLEIYHNDPVEEPDPEKWQTTVSIKLKD